MTDCNRSRTYADHQIGRQARDRDVGLAAVMRIHSDGTLEEASLLEPLPQFFMAGIRREAHLLGSSGRACCTQKPTWLNGRQALTLWTAVQSWWTFM